MGKILIGSLCIVGSFLIVPSFLLYGYSLAVARNVRDGSSELPAWDNIGAKIADGFLLSIALLVWSLPGVVLYVLGILMSGGQGQSLSPLAPLGLLWFLALYVLSPAIGAEFLRGGFGAALGFQAVWRRFSANVGLSLLVFVMFIVAALVGGLGIIAVVIGFLVTYPYAYYVMGHLLGQFARLTDATA